MAISVGLNRLIKKSIGDLKDFGSYKIGLNVLKSDLEKASLEQTCMLTDFIPLLDSINTNLQKLAAKQSIAEKKEIESELNAFKVALKPIFQQVANRPIGNLDRTQQELIKKVALAYGYESMLPTSMIAEAQVDASADTKRRSAVVNQQQPQLQTTQPVNPTTPIPTKPGFVAHMKNKLEKSGMNLGGGSKPNITAQQQISSNLGNQFKNVTGKIGDQMNNAQGKTVLTQLKDSQQQQKKVVGFEGSGLTLNDWKKIKNESIQHIKQLINSDTRFKNSTLETSKEKELGLKSNKDHVTQVYNENSQSVITRMTNPPSDATLIASFKMNQMLNEMSMEKLDGKLSSPELVRIYQAAVLTGCEKSFKMGPQDRAKLESNNYYNQLKSSGIDLNAYVIAYEQQNKKPYPLGEPLDSKIVNTLQQSQPISQPPKNKP